VGPIRLAVLRLLAVEECLEARRCDSVVVRGEFLEL
jgi:hypothetical protein